LLVVMFVPRIHDPMIHPFQITVLSRMIVIQVRHMDFII
jgi:hypothetical protein